jgi:hypothetical protein
VFYSKNFRRLGSYPLSPRQIYNRKRTNKISTVSTVLWSVEVVSIIKVSISQVCSLFNVLSFKMFQKNRGSSRFTVRVILLLLLLFEHFIIILLYCNIIYLYETLLHMICCFYCFIVNSFICIFFVFALILWAFFLLGRFPSFPPVSRVFPAYLRHCTVRTLLCVSLVFVLFCFVLFCFVLFCFVGHKKIISFTRRIEKQTIIPRGSIWSFCHPKSTTNKKTNK